jgi:hypothetical protein
VFPYNYINHKGGKFMTYKKVEVDVYEENPVFAGACGDYNTSCGSSVHHRGASGACGDYNTTCGSKVHHK